VRYLLDTCVLSELVKSVPDGQVLRWVGARKAQDLYLSAITWGELHRGVRRLPDSKRRSELASWLQQLKIGFEDRVLGFDQSVSECWSSMAVLAEAQGTSLSVLDSLIAATALAHDCKLVTRNVRDFAPAGLDVINPWQDR